MHKNVTIFFEIYSFARFFFCSRTNTYIICAHTHLYKLGVLFAQYENPLKICEQLIHFMQKKCDSLYVCTAQCMCTLCYWYFVGSQYHFYVHCEMKSMATALAEALDTNIWMPMSGTDAHTPRGEKYE